VDLHERELSCSRFGVVNRKLNRRRVGIGAEMAELERALATRVIFAWKCLIL
jgi:hypothetical protein